MGKVNNCSLVIWFFSINLKKFFYTKMQPVKIITFVHITNQSRNSRVEIGFPPSQPPCRHQDERATVHRRLQERAPLGWPVQSLPTPSLNTHTTTTAMHTIGRLQLRLTLTLPGFLSCFGMCARRFRSTSTWPTSCSHNLRCVACLILWFDLLLLGRCSPTSLSVLLCQFGIMPEFAWLNY